MTKKIEQFLYTHCTYGTSFYDRRDGESAARTKGYGPRASSIEKTELRLVCQKVESLLYLDPPRGTPGEIKLELDASTGPKRMVYVPERNGCQSLILVNYRSEDTSTPPRPGSYFAHVLVDDLASSKEFWNPIDCLKLWPIRAAIGWDWIVEDDEGLDFNMPSLDGLPANGSEETPAVSGDVLRSFLTSEILDGFDDPGEMIPDEWKARPATDRQRLMATVISEVIQAVERDVTLLLFAEESFAALLFYGIFRLFPSKGCFKTPLSFSTYEADPNRLRTTLAATHVHPTAEPFTARNIQGDHRIVDTFAEAPDEKNTREDGYGAFIVQQIVDGGLDAVERCFGEFGEANNSLTALDAMATAGLAASGVFDGEMPSQNAPWRSNDETWKFHCRCIANHLFQSQCWTKDGWSDGSDMHLHSVAALCDIRFDRTAADRQVATQLLDQLAACDRSDSGRAFLQMKNVAVEFRAYLATQIIDDLLVRQTDGRRFALPEELTFLTEVEPTELRRGFLVSVLSGLHERETDDDPVRLACFFDAVPSDRRVGVLAAIGCALGQAETGPNEQATIAVLDKVQDDELFAFFRSEFADTALREWPRSDSLYERSRSLEIDWRKASFTQDLDALGIFATKADDRVIKPVVKSWNDLLKDLKKMGSVAQKKLAFDEFGRFRSSLKKLGAFDWERENFHRTTEDLKRLEDLVQRVATDRGHEWTPPKHWAQRILPALVTVGFDWEEQNSWLRFQKTDYGQWFVKQYPRDSRHIEKRIAAIIRRPVGSRTTARHSSRARVGRAPATSGWTTRPKKVGFVLSMVAAACVLLIGIALLLEDSPTRSKETVAQSEPDSSATPDESVVLPSGVSRARTEEERPTRGPSRKGGGAAQDNHDSQKSQPAKKPETEKTGLQETPEEPVANASTAVVPEKNDGRKTVTVISPQLNLLTEKAIEIALLPIPASFKIHRVKTKTTQKQWEVVEGDRNTKTLKADNPENTGLYTVELTDDRQKLKVTPMKSSSSKKDQGLVVFVVVCHSKPESRAAPKAYLFATGKNPTKTTHQLRDGKGRSVLPELLSGEPASALAITAKTIGTHKLGNKSLSDPKTSRFHIEWASPGTPGGDPLGTFDIVFELDAEKETLTSHIDSKALKKPVRDSTNDRELIKILKKMDLKLKALNALSEKNQGRFPKHSVPKNKPYWSITDSSWHYDHVNKVFFPKSEDHLKLLVKLGILKPGGKTNRYSPKKEESWRASALLLVGALGKEMDKLNRRVEDSSRMDVLRKQMEPVLNGVVEGHLEWHTQLEDGPYELKVKVLEFTKSRESEGGGSKASSR